MFGVETKFLDTEPFVALTPADLSRDPDKLVVGAMSSGVPDPPHAASEMHNESTLNDMKRRRSAVGMIIYGR